MYERIIALCNEYNIKIRQLEENIGLKSKSLDNIRRGNAPSINTIKAVADYFDVSVDYICGREDRKPSEIDQQFLIEYKKLTAEKKEHLRQYMQFLAEKEKEVKENA